MDEVLYKEFIKRNGTFFKDRKKQGCSDKLVFVDAAFTDLFILTSAMKIASATADIMDGEMVVLPHLRGGKHVREVINSFHPRQIISFKSIAFKGLLFNLPKVLRFLARIRTGNDLVKFKEEDMLLGSHIYDDLLRRDGLPSIHKFSFRQRIFILIAYSFFLGLYNLFCKRNFSFTVLPDNTYRDGLIFELIKHKKIPSITGIDMNGIAMHKYEDKNDYDFHCRTPDKDIIDKIIEDPRVNIKIMQYLDFRTGGLEKQHDIMRAYSAEKELTDREALNIRYGLDPGKPLVMVMAHIFCDAPHAMPNIFFRDYEEWLIKTSFRLGQNPNVEFLIKEHPSVSLYKEEGVIEGILSRHGLSHRLIEKNINTKSLFSSIDALITCGGTAGMEFSCYGVPVLLGAKAPYAVFPYVAFPDTLEGYYREIDQIETYQKLTPEQIKLAKTVLYVIQAVMKIPKDEIGLGSQAFYMGCDFNIDLFMKEMINECGNGIGYDNLLSRIDVLLKGRNKNLINEKML
jgi:hypothetical protein